MAASLDDIDAAVFTALQTLEYTSARPSGVFRLVDRWVPEVESVEDIHALVMNRLPAALLGLEGDATSTGSGNTTSRRVSGKRETISRSTWIVLVAAQDVGTLKHALKGQTGLPGVYSFINSVQGVLNNLFITGTFHGNPLQYQDTRPYFIKRGAVYIFACRFYADYVAPDATYTDADVVTMDDVIGDINRPTGSTIESGGESEDLQNPRAVFDADVPTE